MPAWNGVFLRLSSSTISTISVRFCCTLTLRGVCGKISFVDNPVIQVKAVDEKSNAEL